MLYLSACPLIGLRLGIRLIEYLAGAMLCRMDEWERQGKVHFQGINLIAVMGVILIIVNADFSQLVKDSLCFVLTGRFSDIVLI